MRIDAAKHYLTSEVKTPYFLFVSDGYYLSVIDELNAYGLIFVPMSGFCSGNDKLPDIDGLVSYIEEADINADGSKFVVTGLGEYLALRGTNEAKRTLSRLKDLNVGGAKAILLLRGLAPLISVLEADPRFDDRRHFVVDRAECNISFTLAAASIGLPTLNGIKAVMAELEKGRNGNIIISTAANLDKAILTVHRINNAYEGIVFLSRGFTLARCCGNDAQWAELLMELNNTGGSLDAVFEKHGFDENIDAYFYSRVAGNAYRNWVYFVYLKYKADNLQNGYLRFVLNKTTHFEEFTGNLLNSIIDVKHTDSQFDLYYQERKALVEKFPEADIASFVVNNRRVVSECIYKLTDNTAVERTEVIAWLSYNGMIPQLQIIYPAFAAYMKKYVFKCSELAELLTDYFEAYKRQKLSNRLETEFLEWVDELAVPPRMFNRLPSRNEMLENIDKDGTYLYWLDALGVEYLGLIEALAQKRGLSINIGIARAELPTITSRNRDFYDNWQGDKKWNNRDLDNAIHKEEGGYDFTKDERPIHLARQIEIVSNMIDKAATELALRHCKHFLIVSDHGASRLAVLRRKEEKYSTDTTAEHSGRCCKIFQPYDLPFAAEENGYLVLADYGRFKGSRAANVEVHGGASLEEAVIPVIELSLKNGSITVKLVNDKPSVDYRTGTNIELYIDTPVLNVSAVLNGKHYIAIRNDENHYTVQLSDVKRAGEFSAEIYAGDDLIGKVTFKTQSKSGTVNDEFDELFQEEL